MRRTTHRLLALALPIASALYGTGAGPARGPGDDDPPVVTSFRLQGGAPAAFPGTVLTLEHSVAGRTPTAYRVSSLPDFRDASWLPYERVPRWTPTGQHYAPAQGASPTQAIAISWVNSSVPAPNNEFIVDIATHTTVGHQVPATTVTVTGTSLTRQLGVPGNYTVTVRPRNCGVQPQPSTSTTFHLTL